MPTITRKIQLNFDVPKAELKEYYTKWFTYQRLCAKAANWVMSHQYLQDNVKDFFYFEDNVKKKLANIAKDEDGMLTMSRDNTTYQVLSKAYKGECPMGMMSGVNMMVSKKYKAIIGDVKSGKVSLPTFGNKLPMPIRSGDISNWKKDEEDGNYTFFVYGTSFKTYFGRDMSGNEIIMDRAIQTDEYKFCDSSIQIQKVGGKYKFFLLAVFSFEKQDVKLDPEKTALCRLSLDYPIVVVEKKDKFFSIGTKEEYLHRRLAIKGALQRLQAACKYNNGGKGRVRKMEAIERFEKAEKNYVDSRMHLYSRMLIEYCLKRGIATIILDNYQEVVDETHEESEEGKFLLASWSYFNLSDKIKYKAAIVGIEVAVNKASDEKEEPVKDKKGKK